jgi:hypothetical protein
VLGALHTFVPNALPGVKTHKRTCVPRSKSVVLLGALNFIICEDAARDSLLGVRGIVLAGPNEITSLRPTH